MSRPGPATSDDLDAFLGSHPEWSIDGDALVRIATAPTFSAAIAWVTAVADAAEERNHHPDIDIRWRTITFRLTTHDVGAITVLDLDLAEHIDSVVAPRT